MKNISLEELFDIARSARSSSLWAELSNAVQISRMDVGLSSFYRYAMHYVGDTRKAVKDMAAWLRDTRGYITMEFRTRSIIAILPDSQNNHITSVLRLEAMENTGTFSICGDEDECNTVKDWFDKQYPQIGSVITTLDGFNERGILEKTDKFIPQGTAQIARQSFYPWLTISLEEYYNEFMRSDESVLVLFGPPGTGKSTFLRSLITHGNHNAWLAYNKSVVESARTVNAFFRGNANILAYEDIDNHLGNRENGNTLMSTILNASEGILQHPGRKIVFSTNLSSIDRIDPALLRVGRCFDILKFDLLDSKQAQAVREDVGLEPRDFSEKNQWTLAEILAKQSSAQQTINRFGKRIGFS